MSVSAIIVTRGDVDLDPIYGGIPDEWEVVVWDNGKGGVYVLPPDDEDPGTFFDVSDLSVYGRYAAIQYASHDLIYVQDDDCIVSDPQRIANNWIADAAELETIDAENTLIRWRDLIVANMPLEFRPHYPDSCLVGFGACFHRDLPQKAFDRFLKFPTWPTGLVMEGYKAAEMEERWRRTCDVVFTALTPRVLVDVPVEVLPYAHDSNRMWKQPDHYGERTRVLEMARKVRDA